VKIFTSHYDYLRVVLVPFLEKLGLNTNVYHDGLIGAHGDKAYGYRGDWEAAGIHFYRGVMVYLLTYCKPYSEEVRETGQGWVAPGDWVLKNYDRFKQQIDEAEQEIV